MSDLPILFKGPMVQALIREARAPGTGKTQTRRPLEIESGIAREPQWRAERDPNGVWRLVADSENLSGSIFPFLRIAVGDRLYVREQWRTETAFDGFAPNELKATIPVHYEADGHRVRWRDDWQAIDFPGRLRQGIHMPRWASRITLTVTEVRVQRLQEISEADALAEGMTQETADATMSPDELAVYASTHILCPEARGRILYEHIWDHINGAGAWEINPWVAAYTFAVALGNIDQIAR
jgi:hypothetical protein